MKERFNDKAVLVESLLAQRIVPQGLGNGWTPGLVRLRPAAPLLA